MEIRLLVFAAAKESGAKDRRACDLLVTNTRNYVDWLTRETVPQSASPIQYMPVFSRWERRNNIFPSPTVIR